MSQVPVRIPAERYSTLEFSQDDFPGISIINEGLVDFPALHVFPWHCSILVQFEAVEAQGMPTIEDHEVVEAWEQHIACAIIGSVSQPNALRLGHITWNQSRELLYRVHKPEPVNELLCSLIESGDFPRQFDFRLDPDPQWDHALVHLKALKDRSLNK